jgi:hypothetical protein
MPTVGEKGRKLSSFEHLDTLFALHCYTIALLLVKSLTDMSHAIPSI